MNWYNYVASFFAGAFLANVVPHSFHGISCDRFPTPFGHPVVWAWVNLVAGYVLLRAGKVSTENYAALMGSSCRHHCDQKIPRFRFRQKIIPKGVCRKRSVLGAFRAIFRRLPRI